MNSSRIEDKGDESAFVRERCCTHHWLIEPANGPESMGQCRRCGEKRSFSNDPDAVLRMPQGEQRRQPLRLG